MKRKRVAILGIASVIVALGVAAVAGIAAASGEGADSQLTKEELLSIDPIDPKTAIDQGWHTTILEIQDRAVSWYQDQGVAHLSDDQLEAAIPVLSDAISDPPIETEPDQVMYVHEMIYRREAVCRSLSSKSTIRDEYCSSTSAPELDVPWAA